MNQQQNRQVGNGQSRVSFEFFPPKTPELEEKAWESLDLLAPLCPRFVSVTYGAGGTTRDRTHRLVAAIQDRTGIPAAAHLTCVAASRREIDAVAQRYWDAGIRHVVALRGDPPAGSVPGAVGAYAPHPDGYATAADLVAGLRRIADFEISVAAFPEVHPEARSAVADLDNLKRKIDVGATRAITQFFFDPDVYLRFRDHARAAGIAVPIVPGILPVTNVAQVRKFAAACGAAIPPALAARLDGLDDDPDARRAVAIAMAAEQCRRLQDGGVRDFHFYTLNRADLTAAICEAIGIHCPAAVAA
jgi:methylenetetrahydrofolate reductase (NADPH)